MKNLASHWSLSSECSHPELSGEQKEFIVGSVLGDGCISGNLSLTVANNSMDFLEYISEGLGWLFRNIYESPGFANWQLWSKPHPEIKEYRDWYSSGKKQFPKHMELTPLIVRIWYAGDGSTFDTDKTWYRITNHMNKLDKLLNWFEEAGVKGSIHGKSIAFTEHSGFEELIGEPVPGYERKWPNWSG